MARPIAPLFTDSLGTQVTAAIGEVAAAYPMEIARRKLVVADVKVFTVDAKGPAPYMPGGSVLVVTADENDESLRALLVAAESGDAVAVSDVVDKVTRTLQAVPTRALALPAFPVAQLATIPTLTDVTYGGHVLAPGHVVGDGHGFSLSRLPFAGGQLNESAFSANHYYADSVTERPVLSVAVVRQPALTDVERRVLDTLPAELDATRFGSPGDVANWGLVAAAAVFTFVVVAGVYLAREAQRQMQENQREQERQMQQDVVGQQQQDQGQQQQQDQGQDDQAQGRQQDNGGDLTQWTSWAELQGELTQVNARAAVQILVQVRTQMLAAGQIG